MITAGCPRLERRPSSALLLRCVPPWAARAALRGDPAIALLIQERYWGHWPNQTELLELPPESLGHAFASWFADAGGQPLAQWREGLGITALVERSPFRGKPSTNATENRS